MLDREHLKDRYVARVVELTNENKRLRRELETLRGNAIRLWFVPPACFTAGYFLCCILWRAFK